MTRGNHIHRVLPVEWDIQEHLLLTLSFGVLQKCEELVLPRFGDKLPKVFSIEK